MATEELDIEIIFKLKVEGLKLELGKRGLSKSGTKPELQERLLNHFTTHEDITSRPDDNENDIIEDTTEDEDLKNELEASLDKLDTPTALTAEEKQTELLVDNSLEKLEEVLPDNTGENAATTSTSTEESATEQQNKPSNVTKPLPEEQVVVPAPRVNVGTKSLTENEKIEQRSKRFGAVVSETEKKKARMERFNDGKKSSVVSSNTGSTEDKRLQRASRFGSDSTNTSSTNASGDKLKQRQDRFLDDKIKKRQERFGVIQSTSPTNSSLETRKQQRALKFGIK